VRHGLFSDVLYQVLDGGDGTLWFASSKGIFAARQAELEAVIAGRRPRAGVTSFTTADGMASSECSNDAQPAGWKTADGSLWFSTIRGVVGIRPHELRPNRNAPPVRIEEIEVNGQPAPLSREISLPAGSRLLTIRFAGLTYSAPEKVRYQCRLAGADPDWVETPGPAVTYHNLPPGRYTFAVRTANEEGAWSEAPAAIAITAEAYVTQTPWFYGLCLAALAGCTVLLLRMRGRAADQRFAAVLAERTRIAREIHDTLLQGFAGAALQLNAMSKYVQADPARAGVEIERVLDQIDGCLADARSEIVTLRQSGPDEETFVTRLRHTVEAAPGNGMLQVRFEAAGEPRPLPAEVERNLLRIAGEAVSNAARHARANMVTVRLEYHPVSVHLAAVDDGSGLSAAPAAASHFGLTGMRERTELMGGRFTIESHEGRGTGIDVRIPLRDAV
jgi:signal transduction histidine kinase